LDECSPEPSGLQADSNPGTLNVGGGRKIPTGRAKQVQIEVQIVSGEIKN